MSEWINEWNLPTSSSNSALRPSAFWDFYVKPSSSLQSCAHFADLIFQKCSDAETCFTNFIWNRALATASCTFCHPHLPKELRTWRLCDMFKCGTFIFDCPLVALVVVQSVCSRTPFAHRIHFLFCNAHLRVQWSWSQLQNGFRKNTLTCPNIEHTLNPKA